MWSTFATQISPGIYTLKLATIPNDYLQRTLHAFDAIMDVISWFCSSSQFRVAPTRNDDKSPSPNCRWHFRAIPNVKSEIVNWTDSCERCFARLRNVDMWSKQLNSKCYWFSAILALTYRIYVHSKWEWHETPKKCRKKRKCKTI